MAEPGGAFDGAGPLRLAFEKTVDSCKLGDVDAALVEAGRQYAQTIDDVLTDPETSKEARLKAMYLGPQLVSVLDKMLATPLSRAAESNAGAAEPVEDELATLRGQAKRARGR